MLTTYRARVGAATGAAFVAAIFIGNSLATAAQSQSSHPSGQEVLSDAARAAASTSATVGFVLEIAGFVLFMIFVGYLWGVLRPDTGGGRDIAAGTSLVAAITMLAIKLGSAAPIIALSVDRDHLSPELAQVLNDINGSAFIVSWLPFAVFVGSLAVALHVAGLVGRPTAYVGLVVGVVGVGLAVLGFKDPLGANPLAFLAGMLWLLVVAVRLAVRPGVRRGSARRSTDPALAGA
ncbi:hypothetical protein AB0I34_22900 [Kribbella sp. NPDC050281]|uniref:hypothetical protein n=1 Tax=Kribbella sp. NPDC050281 TaxID=3155515 RepID=UPI0033C8489E